MNKLSLTQKLHKDREEILKFCRCHRRIYIYGVGKVAEAMFSYLKSEEISIHRFAVGKGHKQTEKFYGIEVVEINECHIDSGDGFILCVSIGLVKEICKELLLYGIREGENLYIQNLYGIFDPGDRGLDCKYIIPDIKRPGHSFFKSDRLDLLGIKYGTDKSAKEHNYLHKYEFFLENIKERVKTVMELGIYKGSSLKMWGEYFPNAQIIGVDINEECRCYENGNISVEILDMSQEENIFTLGERYKPQVIIDDASHIWSHQIKAFIILFDKLEPGGIYILEDLQTSFYAYHKQGYDDAFISTYEFLSLITKTLTGGEKIPEESILDDEIKWLASNIEMMSFINESCIIIRK